MILRHLAEGDGDVAAEARFGREEIVETRVTPPLRDVATDGEQVSRRVEQKCEVHRGSQFVALRGESFQRLQSLASVVAAFAQSADEFRLASAVVRRWVE